MGELAGTHIYIPDESHRMHQRFEANWSEIYRSVIIDFIHNDYEAFYNNLPKRMGGVALTFRFLCHDLSPELIALPVDEDSFVELFYCVRKDYAPDSALEQLSSFVRQNVKVVM